LSELNPSGVRVEQRIASALEWEQDRRTPFVARQWVAERTVLFWFVTALGVKGQDHRGQVVQIIACIWFGEMLPVVGRYRMLTEVA
jgi:hypothetical protein